MEPTSTPPTPMHVIADRYEGAQPAAVNDPAPLAQPALPQALTGVNLTPELVGEGPPDMDSEAADRVDLAQGEVAAEVLVATALLDGTGDRVATVVRADGGAVLAGDGGSVSPSGATLAGDSGNVKADIEVDRSSSALTLSPSTGADGQSLLVQMGSVLGLPSVGVTVPVGQGNNFNVFGMADNHVGVLGAGFSHAGIKMGALGMGTIGGNGAVAGSSMATLNVSARHTQPMPADGSHVDGTGVRVEFAYTKAGALNVGVATGFVAHLFGGVLRLEYGQERRQVVNFELAQAEAVKLLQRASPWRLFAKSFLPERLLNIFPGDYFPNVSAPDLADPLHDNFRVGTQVLKVKNTSWTGTVVASVAGTHWGVEGCLSGTFLLQVKKHASTEFTVSIVPEQTAQGIGLQASLPLIGRAEQLQVRAHSLHFAYRFDLSCGEAAQKCYIDLVKHKKIPLVPLMRISPDGLTPDLMQAMATRFENAQKAVPGVTLLSYACAEVPKMVTCAVGATLPKYLPGLSWAEWGRQKSVAEARSFFTTGDTHVLRHNVSKVSDYNRAFLGVVRETHDGAVQTTVAVAAHAARAQQSAAVDAPLAADTAAQAEAPQGAVTAVRTLTTSLSTTSLNRQNHDDITRRVNKGLIGGRDDEEEAAVPKSKLKRQVRRRLGGYKLDIQLEVPVPASAGLTTPGLHADLAELFDQDGILRAEASEVKATLRTSVSWSDLDSLNTRALNLETQLDDGNGLQGVDEAEAVHRIVQVANLFVRVKDLRAAIEADEIAKKFGEQSRVDALASLKAIEERLLKTSGLSELRAQDPAFAQQLRAKVVKKAKPSDEVCVRLFGEPLPVPSARSSDPAALQPRPLRRPFTRSPDRPFFW